MANEQPWNIYIRPPKEAELELFPRTSSLGSSALLNNNNKNYSWLRGDEIGPKWSESKKGADDDGGKNVPF